MVTTNIKHIPPDFPLFFKKNRRNRKNRKKNESAKYGRKPKVGNAYVAFLFQEKSIVQKNGGKVWYLVIATVPGKSGEHILQGKQKIRTIRTFFIQHQCSYDSQLPCPALSLAASPAQAWSPRMICRLWFSPLPGTVRTRVKYMGIIREAREGAA